MLRLRSFVREKQCDRKVPKESRVEFFGIEREKQLRIEILKETGHIQQVQRNQQNSTDLTQALRLVHFKAFQIFLAGPSAKYIECAPQADHF